MRCLCAGNICKITCNLPPDFRMSLPNISNDQLHEAISSSLVGVFETMLSIDCASKDLEDFSSDKPRVPDLGGEEMHMVYVGSVGFVGEINGIVYLYMKANFVNDAAGKITGFEGEQLDYEMVSDVCGELTNMFAGSFKTSLASVGYESSLTIPTVLSGDELFISTMGVEKHLRMNFLCEKEEVVADLILAEPVAV